MFARQAARVVARRRCASPYIFARSFLEPASTSSATSRSLNEPSRSASLGDVQGTDSVMAAATGQDDLSSSVSKSVAEDGPLAAPNAELVASFAGAAVSARGPNAAHRKLLQQTKSHSKEDHQLAKESALASEDVSVGYTSARPDKGKGRAREDGPNANIPEHAVQAGNVEDAIPSFAEYASRSTPVSNSFFVAQPDVLSSASTSASGGQRPASAGELTLTPPATFIGATDTHSSSNGSSSSGSSSSSPASGSPASSSSSSSSDSSGGLGFLPFIPLKNVPIPHIRHPFNTYRFVARLERDGAFNREAAEEIMRTAKALLVMAEEEASRDLVAKADVENEAYLFSAALSELRTEVQMTARTDGIALRSLASQLQREVDSLSQKMREDMANLRNENQLDLNNRKDEASADIAAIEQKILDLNNKFSLLVGDTKAALETSKWIQTRRSIVMIATLALISMAYMSTKPAPPPPAPPAPPSAEDLGLKQIEEPGSAEIGFFGWLGGSQPGGKDGKKEGTATSSAPPPRAV